MLQNFISQKICEHLSFVPTNQQVELINELGKFITSAHGFKVFMLKGYAGTGKTAIVGALVRALKALHHKTEILAPTGRAAKVFSTYSGFTAYTIHKKIYRQKSLGDFRFGLAPNLYKNTLFIVDEVSMITNAASETVFGSGRLLDDLIEFVFSGEGCSLLLLGDTAQLPPVGQEQSHALDAKIIESYGLEVSEFMLTQVVRQALGSGILLNATNIRQMIECNDTKGIPKIVSENLLDVQMLTGEDLIESIQNSYNSAGREETMIITRSNRRANIYNNGIRARVLFREEEINNSDLLMITRNNYFWNKDYEDIDFLANGDIVEIRRVRKHREMYGFRFADLTLHSLDYDWEIDARIWLDTLQSESPALTNKLTDNLFHLVEEDYTDIGNRRERVKKIMGNEFFNALQIKFAYAVTCHKAQGGQWKHVYIDTGQLPAERVNAEFYRWLYTAVTRATEKVFFVNYPKLVVSG
ncbi:MAG: AAA family ATPase [Prevotellaceae bacterium]|nr:AAA family ATPase [Prevotellaceae bacterium]